MADRSVMDESSDADLLALVADSSTTALETLYHRHAPWLTIRLSRRCADPQIVDEVLQDTFMAIWRNAKGFTGKGEPAAWMWGIAVRRLVDAFRRRPPSSVLVQESDLSVVESAEERVLLGIEHGALGGALETLSPDLRAVVQATILDGLTTREAGRLLGLRQGTVKTRMMRARQALREELT
ncbi:RNA polymerase sigma factor [Aeromicrobium panaciterrae]